MTSRFSFINSALKARHYFVNRLKKAISSYLPSLRPNLANLTLLLPLARLWDSASLFAFYGRLFINICCVLCPFASSNTHTLCIQLQSSLHRWDEGMARRYTVTLPAVIATRSEKEEKVYSYIQYSDNECSLGKQLMSKVGGLSFYQLYAPETGRKMCQPDSLQHNVTRHNLSKKRGVKLAFTGALNICRKKLTRAGGKSASGWYIFRSMTGKYLSLVELLLIYFDRNTICAYMSC